MADDKHSDSYLESDESTPLTPTGAELADDDLPEGEGEAPELTDSEIIDDEPSDGYVDDPDTPDINEAKLERATDEVAEEPTVDAGSTAQRRPRAARPIRRSASAEATSLAADDATSDDDEPVADPASDADPDAPGSAVATRRRTVARKDRPTTARKGRGEVETRRTTPGRFVGESVGELRKVVWPTLNQVQQYFIVVLVFVLFIIAFVSLLDLGFGWALLKIFG